MSYNELIALIDACVNRNGVHAITGRILNGVLKAMIQQLGAGFTLGGMVHPTDDPGTPDAPICYFASEVGTYTNFGGLTIAPGEFALFCYDLTDGWYKETVYEGFQSVQANVDDQVGTPEVDVTYNNGVLAFDFRNMKGNTGDPAGFGSITATVDDQIGTPSVSVSSSGPDTAKVISFAFRNLKGETGVTSAVVTVDNTIGTPSCAVSLVGQELHLDFHGLKGAQGDTGVSADYPITIVNNLTTNDPTSALSAAMGVQLESEVSQLELKVGELSGGSIPASLELEQGAILANSGGDVGANNRIRTSNYIQGDKIGLTISSGKVYVFGYKNDGTYITSQGWISASQTIQIAGAAKYRLCFAKNNDANLTPADFNSLGISVSAIYDEVYARKVDVDKRDFAVACGAENGKYINNTGAVKSASGYSLTDYLAISGERIVLTNVYATPNGACGCAFFDADKFFIGYKSTVTSGIQQLVVEVANIPAGAKFIRSTFSTSTPMEVSSGILFLPERNKGDISSTSNITQKLQEELIFPSWNELGDSAIKNNGTIETGVSGYAVTDFLPLNGKGIVIRGAYATPGGASGCVFFDADKQYLGYKSTTATGVQNFSILASDIPSGAKYIRSTYKKSNGVIVYESGVKDQAERYGEGNGMFKTIPSENEMYSIRTEIERNKFRGRGGMFVANWNIGHFSFGNNPSSSIIGSNYDSELAKYRTMIAEMDADVLALCEYSAIFGNDGNEDKATKDVLFGDVPIRYEGTQDNYVCNAIMSFRFLENIQSHAFTSVSTNSYYLTAEIPINGKTVTLVGTHLTRDESDVKQIAEINELITVFSGVDYVIMMADWNVIDKDDFDLFANAGYSLANKGAFGDIDTFTPNKTLPEGDTRVLDNIITKGFKIYDVRVIARDLSDHYPIICGLMMQ